MTLLLSPVQFRGLTLKSRLVVSPMCQYSVRGGIVGDYHLAHLGRFAMGGFAAVTVEATGVTPEGRITYGCPGLWSDAHVPGLARVVDFLRSQGAAAGIQLAHAGRKASTIPPWLIGTGRTEPDAEHWDVVGPSAVPHADGWAMPHALTEGEIGDLVDHFATAARRALAAGFAFVEIHGAHGYLLHQFMSPVANRRSDHFGGSLENRLRFPSMVIKAVRAAWPDDRPLFLRLSATDGIPGGWDLPDSVALSRIARDSGVDVIDVSAGGFGESRITPRPGMFLDHAAKIRREVGSPSWRSVSWGTWPLRPAPSIIVRPTLSLWGARRWMTRIGHYTRRARLGPRLRNSGPGRRAMHHPLARAAVAGFGHRDRKGLDLQKRGPGCLGPFSDRSVPIRDGCGS